ncbi:MAG: hypothetical protein AAGK97_12145, partial [Bacteroidota bacterium]
VVMQNKDLTIVHAGDSRAYIINEEAIKSLTTDHTYVEHLYQNGLISKEEKDTHPNRNIVTKVIGTQKSLEPEIIQIKNAFLHQSKLLLCSDGLYDYLSDAEMMEMVNAMDKASAAELMINTAKQRGGHDNISVIIVERVGKNLIEETKKTKEVSA